MRITVYPALLAMWLVIFTGRGEAQIAEKQTAPDFVLPDLQQKNYQLSKNLGKGPIVINFWATWCVPCREEMKKLKKLHHKYRQQGLEILSVSVDDPKTVGRVPAFIKSRRYPFKILLDTNNEVIRLYQASSPPFTVLLNAKGEIVYSHLGYRQGDEKILEQKIKDLLHEKK